MSAWKCPGCKNVAKTIYPEELGVTRPLAGDAGICDSCGTVMIWVNEHTMRAATQLELENLWKRPAFRRTAERAAVCILLRKIQQN